MKNIFRTRYQQQRKNLTPIQVQQKSKKIKQQLFSLHEFTATKTILLYVSYGNEVDTHDMIKESITMGKRVAVPCTDKTNKQLLLSELHDWNNLVKGVYDILEPKQECRRIVDVKEIDLFIVPGIVFDTSGHRIGHGMGYYDSLLCHTKQKKIALAFEIQISKSDIPVEPHDICVDTIITEKRVITCNI